MQPQSFKKILRCWTWAGGQRFRMTFTADTVSTMGCYGAAGVNVAYWGILENGKRVKLKCPFNLQWDKRTGEMVISEK